MQSYEIGPPPDLPSLLLANRIIYIGMPLVPSVTELIIAQLLYLNYQNEQIITMYINSPGTNSPDGRAFSFDTEAFAIADTMQFIRPPIRTIAVGQAFGTAAMLLSLGQKGNRFALPNASIMLNQPRSRARGQASDVAIKAREIINNRKVTNEFLAKVREPNNQSRPYQKKISEILIIILRHFLFEECRTLYGDVSLFTSTNCFLANYHLMSFTSILQGCGKDLTMIEKDTSRVRYLSPEEGVEYGLIDKVLYPEELRVQVSKLRLLFILRVSIVYVGPYFFLAYVRNVNTV